MVLAVSRTNPGLPSGSLLLNLDPPHADLFRTVLAVVPAPIGMPRLPIVLDSMRVSIETFHNQLKIPASVICDITAGLQALAETCSDSASIAQSFPSRVYRMDDFPAWRLFFLGMEYPFTEELISLAGAELALAIFQKKKPFNKNLGRMMVAERMGRLPDEQIDTLQRKSIKVMTNAFHLFDSGASTAETAGPSFEDRLRDRFRTTLFYGRDREHQAITDHRASTTGQMIETAQVLRHQIEDGDAKALLTMLASLANLPVNLAVDIPLLKMTQADWLLVLDTEAGCFKVCADLFSPGRARAYASGSDVQLPSGDVVIVPLPGFAAEALEDCAYRMPHAKTVGELLGFDAAAHPDVLTTKRSGITATQARFRNGLGPFAIQQGISRYVAAMLLTNPLLTPTGKFYYSRVEQADVWHAADQLYGGLGWDTPVTVEGILAVGSRQVANDATVRAWGLWMQTELTNCPQGKRYSLKSLKRRHNIVALTCASLTSFLLALRVRKILPVTNAMAASAGLTVSIFDKRVGEFPGQRPVPVCALQREVFAFWTAHVADQIKRLQRLDTPECRKLAALLTKYRQSDLPAFFEIDGRCRVIPIGTGRIHSWWPAEFGLAPNFGRHFWQNKLRLCGIADSEIDAFVRHSVSGMDPTSSTSHVVVAEWARKLINALDAITREVGLDIVLGRHEGGAQ